VTQLSAESPTRLGVRAWAMFALAVSAYAAAVLCRTTLGVAGLAAVDHFHARAGIISTFVVVQLLVYTLMQIPAGVLIDRFGSRLAIAGGLAVIGLGQAGMALADSVGEAIPARVVLGAGDALIFTSAIRLLPSWFPARRVPILTQGVGLLGAVGQLGSAIPFVWLLGRAGWRPAFLAAAALPLVISALVLALMHDTPRGPLRRGPTPSPREIGRTVVAVARHPGTRLGLWTHWSSGFPSMVFALFWGFPYLTRGEGRSPAVAGALMTVLVVVGGVAGPLLGVLVGRHPLRRSNLVLAMTGASLVPWVTVWLWPGPAPLWLLVLLCAGLALGGPGSAIGFDFARTSAPAARLGTANGVVNLGGFTATLGAIQLIGVALDALCPDGVYTLERFRLALAVQVPFYVIGLVGLLGSRRKARALLARQGVHVPPWKEALAREWRARSRPPSGMRRAR
jgi:MFS family permease